jgi:hypothetical protein
MPTKIDIAVLEAAFGQFSEDFFLPAERAELSKEKCLKVFEISRARMIHLTALEIFKDKIQLGDGCCLSVRTLYICEDHASQPKVVTQWISFSSLLSSVRVSFEICCVLVELLAESVASSNAFVMAIFWNFDHRLSIVHVSIVQIPVVSEVVVEEIRDVTVELMEENEGEKSMEQNAEEAAVINKPTHAKHTSS